MNSWHSYPSIYNLGHRVLVDLFKEPVLIEEKVDGSQFSFGLFEEGLTVRSKGAEIVPDAPDKMFAKGIEVVKNLSLTPGWTYRTEYLAKPKHNALAYGRIPTNHLALFDVNTGEESYLAYEEKCREGARLGLEVVPILYEGMVTDLEMFQSFLTRESFLGGQPIEGVVIKNYARFGPDHKVLMGKYVSSAFREVHAREWKLNNPKQGDVIQRLIDHYRTPARWAKAVQRMRDTGGLEGSPRDIGLLINELPIDLEKECKEDIKDALVAWAWPKIVRGTSAGFAEWYKGTLLEKQFEVKE